MKWTQECQRQFEVWQRRQQVDQRLAEIRAMRGETIRRMDAGIVAHLLTRDLDVEIDPDPDPLPHPSDCYAMEPGELADAMDEDEEVYQ